MKMLLPNPFDSVTLPGLERNVRLLDTGAYVQVEDLDESENPRSGWFTKFAFSNVDSVGRGNFGWKNYKVDSRAYIPIGTKNRVVAFRVLGDFKDTNGDPAAGTIFPVCPAWRQPNTAGL